MRHLLIFLWAWSPIHSLWAQSGAPDWSSNFGGAAYEWPKRIVATRDGGSIVIGSTNSMDGDVEGIHFGTDIWVIKLDADGAMDWQKCYGGSGLDEGRDIIELEEGGYILAGNTNSLDGDVSGVHDVFQDGWIARLDSTGELVWSTTLGGNSVDVFYSVARQGNHILACGSACSDDAYISGSQGGCDVWVVSLNLDGSVNQYALYGSTWNDAGYHLAPSPDGGFILAGLIGGDGGNVDTYYGYNDIWMLKLDYDGSLQWQATLGGSGIDAPRSITVLNDGSYLLSAETNSTDGQISANAGAYDGWLVKLSASGTLQWEKSIGGPGYDGSFDAVEQDDGTLVVVSEIWSEAQTGSQTPHGGTDVVLTAFSAQGNVLWEKWYGGSMLDRPLSICQETTHSWIVAVQSNSADGDIDSLRGNDDIWVFRVSEEAPLDAQTPIAAKRPHIYPQPASQALYIETPTTRLPIRCSIYNACGSLVFQHALDAETPLHHLQLPGLPKGFYTLELHNNTLQSTQPLILFSQP